MSDNSSVITHALEDEPASVQELIQSAKALFETTFSVDASTTSGCSVAPGRVNLIGEHVDYTGGFVLPMAIEYSTVCYGHGKVLEEDNPSEIVLHLVSTMAESQPAHLSLRVNLEDPTYPLELSKDPALRWTNYITGVVAQYIPHLPKDKGLEVWLAFASNVPLGGGLSSSASLEISVGLWLESTFDIQNVSAVQRAKYCQLAEHRYAYTPCGIMDQFIISAAQKYALLLIDCQENSFQLVKMPPSDDISFVVVNSHVQHDNAGGEYPKRVQQCKEALELIQQACGPVPNLRHVTSEMLQTTLDQGKFPNGKEDVLYRRAHHAVTENERVLKCQDALHKGDWNMVGTFMTASHRSMQHDYETSCEEIDFLVDTALTLEGVYGSRLTGGGFGGCTVSLVETSRAAAFQEALAKAYLETYNTQATMFETTPADGVRAVDLSSMN